MDKFLIELDGTDNKEKYGANALLGISLAVAKAGAKAKGISLFKHFAQLAGKDDVNFVLPVPSFNVINGGSHAGNSLAFQEFMILPTGAETFTEAMKIGSEIYQTLKGVIKAQYGLDATNVGDEGGFAPDIKDAKEGLELLMKAIKESGYLGKVEIAMDVAASEFYKDGKYNLGWKSTSGDDNKTSDEMIEIYEQYCKDYPIVSIEDPFDEDDWEAYTKLTARIGEKVQIVGDDLLVTNPKRIKTGVEKKACNGLLLKVNQIGTITESIRACLDAHEAGWGVMVSHRSGETEDTTIADLVVGLRTGQIKTGAPCRSERLAKYNQILRIEEELEGKGKYAGKSFRKP